MGLRFPAFITLALTLLLAACQAAATPPTPAPTPPPAPSAATPATLAPAATPTPTPSGVAVTASRVETLNSAAAAYAGGDFKNAASLYERVVNTPPGGDESATDRVTVTAFAHFRAMLATLANGDEDLARTHRDALQQTNPNGAFAGLAAQLWDQYGMVGAVRGACAQLQPQIASQATTELRTLQDLGVRVDAATLCNVPQG